MAHIAELLPFVFLGIVIVVFLPTGKISTQRGVRPPSLPYTGDSHRGPPLVAGFMAKFLDLISHLVAAFRSVIINTHDLYTTSLTHISYDVGLHVDPYDLLRSKAEPMGWAGLKSVAFDALSSLEDSPHTNGQPFESIYIQHYVISTLLTILSYPNAITNGARTNITQDLVQNGTTLFNDEYLPTVTFGNNLFVADFIMATSDEVSPLILGLIHLARRDPRVAQAFRHFPYNSTSWDGSIRRIQQIAHSVHCQTPVWPSEVTSSLSDGEVEFIAALLAIAVFTFHDISTTVMK